MADPIPRSASGANSLVARPPKPARYWIGTVPHPSFTPYLPPGVTYLRGQLELSESGFLHWQIVASFPRSERLSGVRRIFGTDSHWEPTRSTLALEYVWKDVTSVAGTRFELGTKPFDRSSSAAWETVWESAKSGDLMAIPADIRVRSYHTIRTIRADFQFPLPRSVSVSVFWGRSGTGKSRRAWAEGGEQAYPKVPTSKFWDGYRGQAHVILDEFRGKL